MASAINGTVPAPSLRWREDDRATLRVTNRSSAASSIHWHGIILPFQMDGVPGISFDGIAPRRTPAEGWIGLFRRGEKVRLRFVNASAMTFFDVRIPGLEMIVVAADGAQYRLDDPGVGLRGNGRRVLTYADRRNRRTTLDPREPGREIQLHLTDNMSRYMWSMDGMRAWF